MTAGANAFSSHTADTCLSAQAHSCQQTSTFLGYASFSSAIIYGIRLSHIFEIPSISNEKPSILIKILKYFDQEPWISIEILGIFNKKF